MTVDESRPYPFRSHLTTWPFWVIVLIGGGLFTTWAVIAHALGSGDMVSFFAGVLGYASIDALPLDRIQNRADEILDQRGDQ